MVTKQIFKTREEWLVWRNAIPRIGSSNIAAILGFDDFTTPLAEWERLMQIADGKTPDFNLFRGQFMEDGVAQWFENETGRKVIKRSKEIAVYQNSGYPDYFECAPDRELFAGVDEDRPILECKDTKMFIDLEHDTLPTSWGVQIQFQMGIMGRKSAILAVCDGSKNLQYKRFMFDAELFATIMADAEAWYEKHVTGNFQPDPINGDDVQHLYPDSTEKVVQVAENAIEVAQAIANLKSKIAELQGKVEVLTDELKSKFTDADTIEAAGVRIATYKTQTRSQFDLKRFCAEHPELAPLYTSESKFRVFRLSKIK